MKIADIRAYTVTVPLHAALRQGNGCHWGRFVRTVVEVETDDGYIGLGEMGGGGESAEAAIRSLKRILSGTTLCASKRCDSASRIRPLLFTTTELSCSPH